MPVLVEPNDVSDPTFAARSRIGRHRQHVCVPGEESLGDLEIFVMVCTQRRPADQRDGAVVIGGLDAVVGDALEDSRLDNRRVDALDLGCTRAMKLHPDKLAHLSNEVRPDIVVGKDVGQTILRIALQDPATDCTLEEIVRYDDVQPSHDREPLSHNDVRRERGSRL